MPGPESSFRMLKILDRFQGVISRTGVDYEVLRRILHVKLIMDSRRAPVILSSVNRKKEEQDKNLFVSSLWMYGLIGLVLTPFVFWSDPEYLLPMSLLSAILMFLIMTSMISDFSSVLLDVRDRSILMTKPIDGRTVGLARSIHAGIYLLLLTGALSAGSLVVGLIKHGVGFFLIYILELILMNMLILVSTSMIYLVLLKYWDGEKLKDLINYVQIGLSATLAIGYQFVIRSFDLIDFNLVFTPAWWQILLPPVWYAAPYEWLFGEGGGWLILLSALAVFVPILLMMIYARLIPSFELYLEKLAHSEAGKGRERGKFDRFLARWVCRSRTEQACFRLSASMLKNEREFKLKVYPTLGLAVLLPYLFFFSTIRNSSFAEIGRGSSYYVLHVMLIMVATVVMMLKYSGKPKAFWLFGSAPMPSMTPLYQGALKAFAIKIFLPLFAVNAVVFVIIFGMRILPDILIVLLTGLMLIPLSAKAMLRTPPFSQAFNMAQQKEGWWVLVYFIVVGGFIGLHYASSTIAYGIPAYIVVLLAVNGWVWTKLYK
ncbi:hypothetical protein [Paenibacillus glucanolyticus]|uniref:hypothetical protein n=1 Tax=Paenibacillus glucanolyticus TaxID=59843 RepID=UPI00096D5958|nr:hypothetical protein [Paenibacillus glucanolyticus]OMF76082.1 hypothetical protein BK142_16450 [Paenibacillus glucanolyticus]